MYHVVTDNFYLIPTAEVPVTNIYRDTILGVDQLPVKILPIHHASEGGRLMGFSRARA
jgi:seryl-tRNA synthetase